MIEVDVPQKSYKCHKLIKPCYTTIRTSSTEALLNKQDIVTSMRIAMELLLVLWIMRYLEELDNRELTNRRLLQDAISLGYVISRVAVL